jgi:hypothetical protein
MRPRAASVISGPGHDEPFVTEHDRCNRLGGNFRLRLERRITGGRKNPTEKRLSDGTRVSITRARGPPFLTSAPLSCMNRALVPAAWLHTTRANMTNTTTRQPRALYGRFIGCLLYPALWHRRLRLTSNQLNQGSFFLTLPTSGLTCQHPISSAG